MRLEGPVTQVARSQQTVYAAVNDVEKYKDYMPSAVSSFATGEDYGMPWFSFTIGGMPEIKMVRSVAEPFSRVVFATPRGAKISLEVRIEALSDEQSSVQVAIEADVNPMLRMMVERPLRRFLEDLSEKIGQVK